ncbi:MAG: LPS export ABC transporter periplasmic protein LptC [Desulfobacterales bacterium]|nr:LPS export ABC transporter periplasmic protein LptC [Desulfobacterales bacterium]
MRPVLTPRAAIRSLLLLIIVATFGLTGISLINKRSQTQPPQEKLPETDATLAMGGVQHMATRKGINEWSVDSESALYYEGKGQVILKKITCRYYEKGGGVITMTADEGTLDMASKDLQAKGNVVVKREGITLETDALFYSKSAQTIVSKTPVKLTDGQSVTTADTLSLDMTTQIFKLKGNVKGLIAPQSLERRDPLAP